MRPNSAKIIHHSEGLGAPTPETVRRRAEELARIDGRAEFNDNDWRAARRELHGGHEVNGNNGNIEMTALVSEHDMVRGDVGHRVENVGLDDSDNLVEELFVEGMDEAVHEQMLAAALLEPIEEVEEEEEA